MSRAVPTEPLTSGGPQLPQLGVALAPTTDSHALVSLVRAADEGGLDLVGVPDHPYSPKHLDALATIGYLLSVTSRVRFFPDVANLPLRPPAVLAKTASTLSHLSGGRFDLGLGAGQAWPGIAALGGPVRAPREARHALEEAVTVIRSMWSGPAAQHVAGATYQLAGVFPGQPPRCVRLWIGAVFPQMLRVTGAIADGWAAPIPAYLPYDRWAEAQRDVDRGAVEAGRDPRSVRRMAQVFGTVTAGPGDEWRPEGQEPLRGTAEQWAEVILRLRHEWAFDDVVFWPERPTTEQVLLFAREVGSLVRPTAVTATGPVTAPAG